MTKTIEQIELEDLTPEIFKDLASQNGSPCVSILMRTHRRGRETDQGRIRLKNLLKEASQKLADAGHDTSIVDPLEPKTNETLFWQNQGEGLAIYLTADKCRLIRLNRTVDETVMVGENFLVQPLVCQANRQGDYFVLCLSWDQAELHRASGGTLTRVETRRLPANFDELVLPRDPEESLQNTSHSGVNSNGGRSTAVFHGQGEGEDKIEADRDQYLKLVGDEVGRAMYNTGLPLVVAATAEVSGHFAATNDGSIDAKVDGSPSQWSDDELRDRSHAAIASHLGADHEKLAERYGTAVANSKGSSDLSAVAKAAKDGRVESLMVLDRNDVQEQTNQIVIDTIAGGGNVYQCDHESMPDDGAPVAAIFRY